MATFKFYTKEVNGKTFAAGVEELFDEVILDAEGMTQRILTDEDVEKFFGGGGKWITVKHKDDLTGVDEEKIYSLGFAKDDVRGWVRPPVNADAGLVHVIEGWSIECKPTVENFLAQKRAVRLCIVNRLSKALYSGVESYKDFTKASTGS